MFVKKFVIVYLVTLTNITLCFSQHFEQRYDSLYKANDAVAIMNLLKQWEAAEPNNPNMLVAYYNYYVDRSRLEIKTTTQNNTSSNYQIIDSSQQAPVSINEMIYDTSFLNKAFSYIDKAINLYPKRLDIRWAKLYMLKESKQYTPFTKNIIEAIQQAKAINYDWFWSQNEPIKEGKIVFFEGIEDFLHTLYTSGNDSLMQDVRTITKAIIQTEPERVESYSTLAMTYAIEGNNDSALHYLLSAEKIAPNNVMILNNIATTYTQLNDTTNAKAYYQKILIYGNDKARQHAQEKLQELK